jgi:hypothetical protein
MDLKKIVTGIVIGIILGLLINGTSAMARSEVELSDTAVVTYLKGKADYLPSGKTDWQKLTKGARLPLGTKVKTLKKARVEFKLPDGSYIRFAENTTFTIADLKYDTKKKKGLFFKVRVLLGRSWANAQKLLGRRSKFEVASKTSVAGVRGTIYRMDVKKDQTTTVKVYSGNVYVIPPPREIPKPYYDVKGPQEVPKPYTEVPKPREVTLQEWEYVVKAMQKIVIMPDGKAQKPVTFDPAKEQDDWIQWNKKRDKGIENP